jgi:uncharacterized protein YfaS (alpha-2-macroglobulin family)
MVKAAKYLAEYPFGCVEQNINRFLPAPRSVPHPFEEGDGRARRRAEGRGNGGGGERARQRAQNDDGTWGWWSGDRGNEFSPATRSTRSNVQRLGYAVDRERVENGLEAVGRMLENAGEDRDASAYLLYVYALHGRWSDPAFRELSGEKKPTAYTLAYLVRAAALGRTIRNLQGPDRERIDAVLPRAIDALRNMQKSDARGVYWEAPPRSRGDGRAGRGATAQVLESLVLAGDRSPLPARY